ncbi:4-deoxy-L-threo-5-hexosulose-uronate ketol-isomerase [Lachnospiraceae bacterium C7]|nr:4-deoxy-L-threo-5-hexosulose-uronate ketol-isomerase [Lachnospiraceae bacterium C7]
METRYASSPKDVKNYTTQQLRDEFMIEKVFVENDITLVYSQSDRIIVGGALPVGKTLELNAGDQLRADYFLQRRELGIINIGGDGIVEVDGKTYEVSSFDGMYVGLGKKKITFASKDQSNPAKFYLNSTPAHKEYPTVLIKKEGTVSGEDEVLIKDENKVELGTLEESNHRVINKYILPGQVESCQLVMGMTELKPGSVWNTMPCHTHDRRMEVYLYFKLPEDAYVMHYMGEKDETRHIVMRNEQAVISPSWSIHAGSGTRAYTFIWGMAGENQDFDDMDGIENKEIM